MKRQTYVDDGRHLHLINVNRTGNHNNKIHIFTNDEEKDELGKIQGNWLRAEEEKPIENNKK